MNDSRTLPVSRPPRHWRILLFVAIFLSGAICGAGLSAFIIHRAVRQAVARPELRVQRATRFLTRRLKLDNSQQEQTRAVLERQALEFNKLRLEVWPRVLQRLDLSEREIAALLSPAQRQKWEKMARRLRQKWLISPQDK
ncbi:MAG: hypothetical protein HY549_01290 [Elusimicrobia bacterium]|nr:hypothetical protein [Elusimicrobiota bacterium]